MKTETLLTVTEVSVSANEAVEQLIISDNVQNNNTISDRDQHKNDNDDDTVN